MMILPGACVLTFGKDVPGEKRKRKLNKEVKTKNHYSENREELFWQPCLIVIFLVGLTLCFVSERPEILSLRRGISQKWAAWKERK